MPNPITAQQTNINANGRRNRYVKQSVSFLGVRTDETAERHLEFIQHTLTGDKPGDVPSQSAVVRRALAVYAERLQSREGVWGEHHKIREGTILPIRKRYREHRPRAVFN